MTRAIIILIFAFVSFYWAAKILIFPKRRRLHAQMAMMLTLLVLAALSCTLAAYSIPGVKNLVALDACNIVLAPLCPILYYIFVRILTSRKGVRPKDFLWFIPVLALIGVILGLNLSMGREGWENQIRWSMEGHVATAGVKAALSFWLFRVAVAVEFAVSLIYGNYRLKVYHAELENYYSELIGFADSMDRYVIIYTWAALFVSVALCLSNNIISEVAAPQVIVLLVIGAIIVNYVGKYTYAIEQSAEDLVEMLEKDAKKAAEIPMPGTAKSSIAKYSAALKKAIEEDEVYLEPGIELVDLAERLGTNRTYLSNIIHDEYGQNFAEFINSRRIKHAIKIMQESEEQFPMRYIAVKCGYTSIQTFYSNFARYTGGKTPASYQKSPAQKR